MLYVAQFGSIASQVEAVPEDPATPGLMVLMATGVLVNDTVGHAAGSGTKAIFCALYVPPKGFGPVKKKPKACN